MIIKNFSDLRVTPSFTLLACISCVLSQILLPVCYFPVTVLLLIAHVFTYRRVCLWFYMWRLLYSSVTSLVCCLPVSWIQFAIFFPAFGFCLDSAYLDFPTSKIKVRFLRINSSLFSIWVLSFHTIWHVLTFYAFDLTVESIFISWTYAQLLLFLFLSLELTSFRLSFHFLKTHHDTAQIPLDREKTISLPHRKENFIHLNDSIHCCRFCLEEHRALIDVELLLRKYVI